MHMDCSETQLSNEYQYQYVEWPVTFLNETVCSTNNVVRKARILMQYFLLRLELIEVKYSYFGEEKMDFFFLRKRHKCKFGLLFY